LTPRASSLFFPAERIGGDRDDRYRFQGGIGFNSARGRVTVHDWHLDIHQDQIGPLLRYGRTEIVSRLERVELGTDADGDPITSLVVLPAEGLPTKRSITRKLSDRQRLALAALDECTASSGQPAPADLDLPARTIVVQLNAWREELYRKGVLDREAKSPREEFRRVRSSLQARGLIGVSGELVWKA
jgi:hypothetical protein